MVQNGHGYTEHSRIGYYVHEPNKLRQKIQIIRRGDKVSPCTSINRERRAWWNPVCGQHSFYSIIPLYCLYKAGEVPGEWAGALFLN